MPSQNNKLMKLSHVILAIAAAVTPFCSIADEPVKSAHLKAHQHRHIAKNTPAINTTQEIPGYSVEVNSSEHKSGVSAMSSRQERVIDDLLTEARRHLGKPYVHGAKGPKAFDCSGFSSYVYRQFGYKISPASRMQATEGVEVAKGDLRKGDLVFFTSRSSRGAVGHVGIVVSADNATGKFKFIHASIRGVKISENEGYYKSRYLGARRIITE